MRRKRSSPVGKTGKSAYVFCNERGERRNTTLNPLRMIGKQAGIANLTPHILRHTFASHLVMNGVDLVTVKELLGHANIQMTMIYVHLNREHLKQAVAKLGFKHQMSTTPQGIAVNAHLPTIMR